MSWVFLFQMLWFQQPVFHGGDVVKAFDNLQSQLAKDIAAYNRGDVPKNLALLETSLIALETAVRRRGEVMVDRDTNRTLVLAAKDRALFGAIPTLPPEVKRAGRWLFEPIRFQLRPDNFFVFAVSFRSDTTVRMRSVRLIFRDGTSRLDDTWADLEDGNGLAFSKDQWLPWIAVNGEGEPRLAKPLAAIEILGSAQDGNESAQLEFQIEIPDPAASPGQEILALIAGMKENWSGQIPTANRLNRYIADCRNLAAALNLPFCFDTPAID